MAAPPTSAHPHAHLVPIHATAPLILLTRPAGQSAALAQRLRRAGLRVSNLALMRICANPEAAASLRARLAAGDDLVFVSPNAARHALRLAAGARPAAAARLFAVGPGTAAVLEGAGWGPVLRPAAGYTSEALLALPELAQSTRPVALITAPGGRDLLARTLARSMPLTRVEVYRREPLAIGPARLAQLAQALPDLLAVTSLETLEALRQGLPSALLKSLQQGALMVVSSARLQAAAQQWGWPQVRRAASALPGDLAAELIGSARALV